MANLDAFPGILRCCPVGIRAGKPVKFICQPSDPSLFFQPVNDDRVQLRQKNHIIQRIDNLPVTEGAL